PAQPQEAETPSVHAHTEAAPEPGRAPERGAPARGEREEPTARAEREEAPPPKPEPVAQELRNAEESAQQPRVRAAAPAAPKAPVEEAEERRLTPEEALAPRRQPGGWVDPVAAA